jgi:hypothetical protein
MKTFNERDLRVLTSKVLRLQLEKDRLMRIIITTKARDCMKA